VDKYKSVLNIQDSVQKGMLLAKCRKCGCLQESLKDIKAKLYAKQAAFSSLFNVAESSLEKMEPIEYT